MAYNELIKNFNKIRDYMREFYVYGFKSREDYTGKSARSYDDERRRIESWLGDYMHFKQTPTGKNVFISIDCKDTQHNPLYKAWKTKSFTDGDITLHFIIFDILNSPDISLNLNEISEKIDEYLDFFDESKRYDISTVRKKINEYVSEGILTEEKRGKTLYFRRKDNLSFDNVDILNYFSEVAPCGVIGSFLLDKIDNKTDKFSFKHHYITNTIDSDILYKLFDGIKSKSYILIENLNRNRIKKSEIKILPLKIYISVQSGRQYLMAYFPRNNRIMSFRLDKIISIKPGEYCEEYDDYIDLLKSMKDKMWGVSSQSRNQRKRIEHVDFTIKYSQNELFIKKRLEREKRCGTLEYIDDNTIRFSADVYDSSELIPWIRTFICRITEIHMSNSHLEREIKHDIRDMYSLYGLDEGGTEDVVQ